MIIAKVKLRMEMYWAWINHSPSPAPPLRRWYKSWTNLVEVYLIGYKRDQIRNTGWCGDKSQLLKKVFLNLRDTLTENWIYSSSTIILDEPKWVPNSTSYGSYQSLGLLFHHIMWPMTHDTSNGCGSYYLGSEILLKSGRVCSSSRKVASTNSHRASPRLVHNSSILSDQV